MQGSVFGSWTIINVEPGENHITYAHCRCACGRESTLDLRNLTRGLSRQCRSCATATSKRKHTGTKDGKPVERLYRIWKNMKYRCRETSARERPHYFDRGITVCSEWEKDYAVFRDWALGNGYADDLTIDRRDNNLGYSPDNCRWISQAQQMQNRRPSSEWKNSGRLAGSESLANGSK